VEKNPLRPVETYDRYIKLMEVAEEVDWRLPVALSLAESTGQRVSSILGLQRRDIDLDREPSGRIWFRAEHQKNGHDHEMPLTPECARILAQHLDKLPEQPEAWLFPGEREPDKAVDVSKLSKLLRKAYTHAGLKTLPGGLWHPWRRKWATERKGMPLKDVAKAGNWKTSSIVLLYQQSDEETLNQVVLGAGKLYDKGLVEATRTELTPVFTPAA